MDQRTVPSPRIMPLPPERSPELKEQFEAMRKNLGFIPNTSEGMSPIPSMSSLLATMGIVEVPCWAMRNAAA